MTANNYSIVQTVENDDVLLSVLPSRWVLKNGRKKDVQGNASDGFDLCYWPKGVSGYRLLEKAKKDPQIPADTKLLSAYRCKIKRNKFASYAEAFREQKLMEIQSDTDEYEPRKKMGKSTAAAELFKQIQSRPGPSRSISTTDSVDDRKDEDIDKTTDLEDSFSEPFPKLENYAEQMHNIAVTSHSQPLGETTYRESGSTTPMLRSAVTEESNLRELVLSLHNKTDENTKQIECLKQSNNRCVALLSQMNAKLDVIAIQKPPQIVHVQPESFGIKKIPLTSVKCLADMESLDNQSKNELFVQSVVQFLGSMHGKHRYVGEGTTVCLQIINYFFDREFLMSCSWSGISRNKKDEENVISKIPFHKFDGIIDMFHKVVLFSDPSFSKVQCEQFLHRCLRNSKQRFVEIKGIRAPVARKRCKRNEHQPNQTVQGDIDEEVIVEEYLVEAE